MSSRASRTEPATDRVGRMLHVWKREIPDLDLETEGIVERVQHLNKRLEHVMNDTLAQFDLDKGEWQVLTVLRRSGEPYRLSPGAIARYMNLSAAAVTNRLNQLEGRGLVRRLPDSTDRRAVKVELTPEGWKRWQDSVGAQAEKELLIASALTEDEKKGLNELLMRLLLQFEEPDKEA